MEVKQEKTAAQRLSEFMEETCRNRSAVARKAGIPIKSLAAMLSGKQQMPTEKLKAVCRAMDVSSSRFLDD